MALRRLFKNLGSSSSSSPELGLANGLKPGHLGVWIQWSGGDSSVEFYRVLVHTDAENYGRPLPSLSYTFAPAFNKPFCRSLDMPYDFMEFLVGVDRATQGSVTIEAWGNRGWTLRKSYELSEVIRYYRGRGRNAPEGVEVVSGYASMDAPEIAKMPREELAAYSEKIKAEIAEKLRKEEEERKAREEAAAKAAAEKAAAAKAAAEKAAADKAGDKKPAGASANSGPSLKPARVGLFYGTSTGNTEEVANLIKAELGDTIDYVKNITQVVPQDLTVCEMLILGVPTWHIGEMQDDWAVVLPEFDKLNFNGKKLAVFGLGDGKGYPDTYVDAMQELVEKFEKTGAKLVGLWPTEGYEFQKSKAIRDGKFMGLVIDVENQDNLTEGRVKTWCAQIRKELSL